MVAKDRRNATGSPRVEVGEIDTRQPFQSVKDAVTMFGEGAFSGEKPVIKKPKPHSAERVWPKETQLHLAEKELNKLKDQLKNAELTKAQALAELEKAKRTVDELTQKLKSISESKDQAKEVTENAKAREKELEGANNGKSTETTAAWKQDLETTREQYMTIINELDAAKQVLRKVQQDYNLSFEVRASAVKQVREAEETIKTNQERAIELSNENGAVQKSIEQIKLASLRAQQQHAKMFAEKDVLRESYKASLEVSAKKLLAMKDEFDPQLTESLEEKLAETLNEIGALQKEMQNAKALDLDSVKTVTLELDDAKESLQKILEEESSLKRLVETLKVELENVKKEHSELKEKEAETETTAGNLHIKLQKCKSELEAWMAEESKTRGASEELISTLEQLSSETEIARREAEDMKNRAAELKKEAEVTRLALEEAEKKLKVALEEAEEAKAAEASALEQIKVLSERTSAARASTSESGAKITISREEFESLSRKVEESDRLAEMKVAAAMAQVEAVKASENEALKRLESTRKDIEEMKSATQEALKKAEMAEAAKRAVESELRRWREREQKKAAEAAARILAESEMSMQKSPHHYRVHKHNPPSPPPPPPKIEIRKLEKEKSMVPKKVLLPNISGIFHRKKHARLSEAATATAVAGMAAHMLVRVALLRFRLLHQQRPTARFFPTPYRLWCSTAAASESGHSEKEEGDATYAVNRPSLFSTKETPKLTRMDDPDYRKWKDKESEILRDIEPIVLLTKDILHSPRYMDGDQLTPEDEKAVVKKLLAYHPRSEDKIGPGLDCIMVDRHPQFKHSRCLFVVRTDGGWIDFSYQKCLRSYIRDKYPSYAERFISEHFKRGSR